MIRLISALLILFVVCASPAGAQQPGGGTQSQLSVDASVLSGACTGSGTGIISANCVIPNGNGANATVFSGYAAPVAFNPLNPGAYQLATLGTSARIDANVFSFAGTIPISQPSSVVAYSRATYLDYLQLGANRPSSVVLTYELTGSLTLPSPADPSFEARFEHSYEAQSGKLSGDGSFGSFASFGRGTAIATSILRQGQIKPTITEFVQQSAPGAFGYATANIPGGTQVMITLGAPFFSNPDNDVILLRISASSLVSSPSFLFASIAFGTSVPIAAESDFAHTLRMVGVSAFDSDGNDVTASALVGFASMQPVPEPHEALMLLAGLAVLGALARRRRA